MGKEKTFHRLLSILKSILFGLTAIYRILLINKRIIFLFLATKDNVKVLPMHLRVLWVSPRLFLRRNRSVLKFWVCYLCFHRRLLYSPMTLSLKVWSFRSLPFSFSLRHLVPTLAIVPLNRLGDLRGDNRVFINNLNFYLKLKKK